MKHLIHKLFVALCVLSSAILGQDSGGVTRSAGDVGSRSGQQLNVRYYAGIGGVYDDGQVPFATDAQGNLFRVPGIYGVEARAGAFGVHRWRRSQLGIDYAGAFRHYPERPFYDSIDQALTLNWTHQQSEHLSYELRESAGTYGRAGAIRTGFNAAIDNPAATPASQLFDTRTYYSVSSASASYILNPRTSYTFSGDAFVSNRRAEGLADSWGYTLTGLWNRRFSQRTSIGARYALGKYYTPNQNIDSLSHTFEGTYSTQFGQFWTLNVRAGIFISQVNSQLIIPLSANQALLVLLSRNNTFPSGSLLLRRQFKRALFNLTYARSMGGGNGFVSIARLESGTVGVSYTGIRHWNFGVDGGYYGWKTLSGGFAGSSTFNAGAGVTYDLTRSLHLSARYDARHYDIDTVNYFPSNSSRVSIMLMFSPGDVPLSLW